MPAITATTPGQTFLDMGDRSATPDLILARYQQAFRLKSELPVVSVVTEQMLTNAPHIDTISVILQYPEPEKTSQRVDVRA